MDTSAWLLLGAVGLGAGVISTLLGVGVGILIVPVLHYALGMPWIESTALSLAVIAVQAPFGLLGHARRGAVDWKLAVPLAIGGLGGVAAGIWLQPRVPVFGLQLLFAVLMLVAAARLVTKVPTHEGHPGNAYLGFAGILSGVTSKLLGVGGGIVTVPMLGLRGVRAHTAVGTSLVPVFTNAAVATAAALATGLDLSLAPPLILGALAGSPLGTRLAHALPDKGLRRVVAAGLVVGALYIVWRAQA